MYNEERYPTRDSLVQDIKTILKRDLSIQEKVVYEIILDKLETLNHTSVKDFRLYDIHKGE